MQESILYGGWLTLWTEEDSWSKLWVDMALKATKIHRARIAFQPFLKCGVEKSPVFTNRPQLSQKRIVTCTIKRTIANPQVSPHISCTLLSSMYML